MKVYKGQYLGKNHDIERKNEVNLDKISMEFAVYEENHGKSRKLFEDINLKILIRVFEEI